MTPAEKAKWLVQEMKGGCCRCPHDSKEAALICCDEVLQSLLDNSTSTEPYNFWQQVKTEIQKL
jgi:hypothetical protein